MRTHRGPAASDPLEQDLTEMWKALLSSDWRALAVVPAGPGIPVRRVLDALHETSKERSPAVRVVDARGLDAVEGKRIAGELAESRSSPLRSVVVLDAVTHSLTGIHVLPEVSAVLLVVQVGDMHEEAVSSAVAMIGAERIVGSVAVPHLD